MRVNLIKSKRYFFTLLEVMIAIALLAIIASSLFWRLDRMVAKNRFDSDVNRFRSTLVSTRSLAINTKMDFRLELKQLKDGWAGRIVCREDFDIIYPLSRFSNLKLSWDRKPVKEFFVDFYSSGFVGPKGLLTLSSTSQRREFKFPEFFYRQEDISLPPLHPSEVQKGT
jgi:prepilin-type N-terminal cleavage/methylation domain-containing protein